MSDVKSEKIVMVKMPSFTRLLIGGVAAYWLSTIMNPAFVAIAVLVILLIPVLTMDNIIAKQFRSAYKQPEPVKPRIVHKETKAAEPLPVKAAEPSKTESKKGHHKAKAHH